MKAQLFSTSFFLVVLMTQTVFAQTLPVKIKSYLDRNYKGWKLSRSEKGCGANVNNGIVTGNFNGDKNRDYALKITRGRKGYVIAFLAAGNQGYKPFVLHNTDAGEVKGLSLGVYKKGETYEVEDLRVFLRYDAPSDFRCESDVGGIHLYRNGKFAAY